MLRSVRTSPHVTTVTEADVTGLVGTREKLNAALPKDAPIRLASHT